MEFLKNDRIHIVDPGATIAKIRALRADNTVAFLDWDGTCTQGKYTSWSPFFHPEVMSSGFIEQCRANYIQYQQYEKKDMIDEDERHRMLREWSQVNNALLKEHGFSPDNLRRACEKS